MLKKNKTILIVEDDQDICELMRIVISGEGYKTKTFSGISKKLEDYIVKNKPALIVMDLWISGVDSTGLIKSLKKYSKTSDIPVIIVSAKNSLEKIAKQAGAQGYLAKPFNVKDLVDCIKINLIKE